jgi:hypothetical protein
MSKPLTPEIIAWLKQAAAVGIAEPLVLCHLLERVDALEADATEQSQSSFFCNEAIVRRLEALEQRPTCAESAQVPPTPEAAPVATDKELKELCWGIARKSYGFSHKPLRALYNLGRKHGAAAAQPSAAQPSAAQPAPPVAPAGGLVERVGEAMERHHGIGDIEGSWDAQARAAILEVVAWLREIGNNGFADDLQQEADR